MKRILLLIYLIAATLCGCKNVITYPTTPNPPPGGGGNSGNDEAAFTAVKIEAQNNKGSVTNDVTCTIAGDSITAIVPEMVTSKKFALTFTLKEAGTVVKVGDTTLVSGTTVTDFSKVVSFNLTSPKGLTKTYRVIIKVFTGLPILYITTSTGADVTSKEVYMNGSVVIDPNNGFPQTVTTIPMQIKGRGNSTWANYPKKPYKIKLNSKTAMLGMPAAKDWALLANYNDKTMMRTKLAFELGRRIGADFTPQSRFVEVFLNGKYWGNYQLASTVEIHDNRVNIKELKTADITGGYLLELDYRMDALTTWKTNKNLPFTLKDPEELAPDQLNYIKAYIQDTENALYSATWTDPVNGYAKYIDPDSFMRWYAVEEIVKNQDSWDFSSIYYHKNAGSKLGMGPIWDFDISMGNCDYSPSRLPESWYTRNAVWMIRLAQDPGWNLKWRAKWTAMRNKEVQQLLADIDTYSAYLKLSAAQNFKRWPILDKYVYPNAVVLGDYDKEVAYLKDFMTKRIAWIDANIKSY
jgi:spore coat protein CotH